MLYHRNCTGTKKLLWVWSFEHTDSFFCRLWHSTLIALVRSFSCLRPQVNSKCMWRRKTFPTFFIFTYIPLFCSLFISFLSGNYLSSLWINCIMTSFPTLFYYKVQLGIYYRNGSSTTQGPQRSHIIWVPHRSHSRSGSGKVIGETETE